MYKATIIYNEPADADAFDEHYAETHAALARRLPGLQRFTAGKCDAIGGEAPAAYAIAQLFFRTKDEAAAAFASPEGQAAADDIPLFASGGVTVHFSDDSSLLA